MGRRGGRSAALTPDLARTLARVAALGEDLCDCWWVIGSAAVVLHGADTIVRDVDLLVSPADAMRLSAGLALANGAGDGDPLFRSAMLLRWTAPPLTVEIMADLRVADDGRWRPVAPRTREARGGVFVPSAGELAEILARFGRAKDRDRIAALTRGRGTA